MIFANAKIKHFSSIWGVFPALAENPTDFLAARTGQKYGGLGGKGDFLVAGPGPRGSGL